MLPVLLAICAFVVTFAVLGVLLMRAGGGTRGRLRRLATVLQPGPAGTEALAPDMAAQRDLIPWLTRWLSGTDLQRHLQAEIIRAGLLLRPAELLGLISGGVIVGAAGGFALSRLLGAAMGGLVLGIAPWVYLKLLQARRKRRLMLQLPDALDLICASVRTGYGFVQAMGTVADQMTPPIRNEARRLVDEVGLGLPLDVALQRMMERTDQHDVEILCSAVQIQTRTGGNLAEVLSNLSGVIRGRIQLAGEIAALTAEGRLSAFVLLGLPFAMAAALSYMSPGWLRPLFADGLGRLMLGGGAVAVVTGIIWMRKLLTVDV